MPRVSRLLLPVLALLLCGCSVTIPVPAHTGLVFAIPLLFDDGRGRMNTGGGYYDTQWFSDPDSHPAVRPKPKQEPAPADAARAP